MSLSSTQVSQSCTLSDPAPTALVTVNLTGIYPGALYLVANHTNTAIAGLSQYGTGSSVVSIQFKEPSSLGLGTFKDTLQLGVSTDAAGTKMVMGSPQALEVTLIVGQKPPPTLTALSPTSAIAGTVILQLTATGTLYTPQSQLLWNGTPLPTTYVSPTQLTAKVPVSNLAAVGMALVSVASSPGGQTSNAIAFTVLPPR
jgi:hypothetical protein